MFNLIINGILHNECDMSYEEAAQEAACYQLEGHCVAVVEAE